MRRSAYWIPASARTTRLCEHLDTRGTMHSRGGGINRYFSVMLFRNEALSGDRANRSMMRSAASVGFPFPFDV